MRWKKGRRSSNVDDRRGKRIAKPAMRGGLGLLVIVVVAMFFGVDPQQLATLVQVAEEQIQAPSQQSSQPVNDELGQFVSVVLADTEDTWHTIFNARGRSYKEPELVLFNGMVQSACGFAKSATGPFYCPADHKVYIDLDFYRELKEKFNAPGDFAQAYVIAHEVGHHVQNLEGTLQKVQSFRKRGNKVQTNRMQVRLELQADCYAGVWAHHAQKARDILEEGDIEEALNAASSIGDDRIQQQTQGYVIPDSFTHGSSEQRMQWFVTGIKTGDPEMCNTFDADIF